MASLLPEQTACPRCNSHFLNSSLLEKSPSHLKLRCENCDGKYELKNTETQRGHLSNKFGVPSQIVQLQHLEQLRIGDAIAYKRRALMFRYEHHAIVTDIDKHLGTVTVVEFARDLPLRKGYIVKEEKSFKQHIKDENAWVRRYMPLDCSPLSEVLDRAHRFIDNPNSAPKYDIFRWNCQHLVSWCKSGKLMSDEADMYRKMYTFAINSVYVISLFFSYPIVTFGIILLDTYVHGSRISADIKLINEKMADTNIIMNDIISWLIQILGFWMLPMLFPGKLIVPAFIMVVNQDGYLQFEESKSS